MDLRQPWSIVAEHEDWGEASVSSATVCLDCGRLRDDFGWRLNRSNLFMLRAAASVGRTGSWRELRLPRFREVGTTVGSLDTIRPTIRRRRLHVVYEHMTVQSLEGLVREALHLPPNLWPYGLLPRGWNQPLVIHHGLAWKFARKRDRPHLYLMNYTGDAIRYPTEVWLGTHRGKPRIRFFKKLSATGGVHTLLVCADPRASVIVTSYIAAPHVCDASREGTLLYASWATELQ